ncbi:MAG: lipid A biosynthesis lauroyl acyltransferase, partial [Pseudomonadota bacterium]
VCAATFNLEVTALFRPPNNPYIAKRVLQARTTNMGQLVPSKAGAAWGLARALDRGKSVGVLVDQKFGRGRPGTFFSRPVKTNPLLPKLARQYNCPVHPARCIRLPNGRYRLELEEAIDLPRDDTGQVDVDASAQMLNDVVERWVREYPSQWMWLHRRWKI